MGGGFNKELPERETIWVLKHRILASGAKVQAIIRKPWVTLAFRYGLPSILVILMIALPMTIAVYGTSVLLAFSYWEAKLGLLIEEVILVTFCTCFPLEWRMTLANPCLLIARRHPMRVAQAFRRAQLLGVYQVFNPEVLSFDFQCIAFPWLQDRFPEVQDDIRLV
jgi:hypothetical protein